MSKQNFVSSFRRCAALIYDLFIFTSLCLISTMIIVLNIGAAIEAGTYWFQLLLLLICYLFYVWFWTHGGQTLGMAAWKFKIVDSQGLPVTFKKATLRFFLALCMNTFFGIGFIMSFFHKEKKSLYDQFSGTQLIRVY